jgi:hypothetical protein
MSKKSFIIILILSVIVTYGAALVYDLMFGSILSGEGGVPFKFTSGSLFGGSSTNYLMLILDIVFWFFIIWIIWQVFTRILKR